MKRQQATNTTNVCKPNYIRNKLSILHLSQTKTEGRQQATNICKPNYIYILSVSNANNELESMNWKSENQSTFKSNEIWQLICHLRQLINCYETGRNEANLTGTFANGTLDPIQLSKPNTGAHVARFVPAESCR